MGIRRKRGPRLTPEEKRVVAEMTEIRELIAEFGLVLSGYDPGISAYLKGDPKASGRGYMGEPISFDYHEWQWLRPILEDLRDYRKQKLLQFKKEE